MAAKHAGNRWSLEWQDKDGQDRYSTDIRGDTMQMLGRREGAGEGREPGAGRSEPRSEPRSEAKAAAPKKPAGKFDDMEDDIPF